MKKQVSMRLSALTETQLAELTSKLGTNRTEVVTLAVNEYYNKNKLEEKMNKKQLSQAHERIIEWVGESDGFPANLTAQEARDMLRWLEENDISVEREVDIEKLRDYCEERGF